MTSYAGTIEISGGTFELNGFLSADNTVVSSGAILSGNGYINGELELAGEISPGNEDNIGILSISKGITCHNGSSFLCDITSNSNRDVVLADSVSGSCSVFVRQAKGAIPVNLEIIKSSTANNFPGFTINSSQSNHWQLSSTVTNLLITDITGDSDGDGLNDWWEFEYFNNRTNAVAGDDADGDGANNLQEHDSGTNPLDSDSFFRVVSFSIDNNDRVITWSSVTNKSYQIYRSSNIFSNFIQIASNIVAIPPYNTYRDKGIYYDKQYFYKIKTD